MSNKAITVNQAVSFLYWCALTDPFLAWTKKSSGLATNSLLIWATNCKLGWFLHIWGMQLSVLCHLEYSQGNHLRPGLSQFQQPVKGCKKMVSVRSTFHLKLLLGNQECHLEYIPGNHLRPGLSQKMVSVRSRCHLKHNGLTESVILCHFGLTTCVLDLVDFSSRR